MPDSKKIEKQIEYYTKIAWTLAIAAILLFFYPIIAYWFGCLSYTFTEYATFVGGTAGPLSALAGFLFVYIAFQGQQIQIKKQDKQFERQSFESTFFILLDYYNTVTLDFKFNKNNPEENIDTIKRAIGKWREDLGDGYVEINGELSDESYKIPKEDWDRWIYDKLYPYKDDLFKLLKTLMAVVAHVNRLEKDISNYYYEIILLHVSNQEAFVFFYFYITHCQENISYHERIYAYEFLSRINKKNLLFEHHFSWLQEAPYNPYSQ